LEKILKMKMLFFILALILVVSCITGCQPSKTTLTGKTSDKGNKSVTVSQQFEWDNKKKNK
jgi:hypothetical protein